MAKILACLSIAMFLMIATSQSCPVVVEKGKSTSVRCFLLQNVTSLTFQLLTGNTVRNISTCNFTANSCTDFDAPAGYNGYVVQPPGDKRMILNITNARTNETEFKCVSDNGFESDPCQLVVYETNVIVEKGQPATLNCPIPSAAASITWQLLDVAGETFTNISTCTVATNVCTNNQTASYDTTISTSASGSTSSLNVTSANITETVFSCVANNGQESSNYNLEVYSWPSKPDCSQTITATYVEINCTTSNVYPTVRAYINRQGVDFTSDDFDYRKCEFAGSAIDGTSSFWCAWRVPMKKVIFGYNVYVRMVAIVSNQSLVSNKVSVSNGVKPLVFKPIAVVLDCPVDPQVVSIRIGAQVNCTCHLTELGSPPGSAQWLTSNKKPVGVATADGSSILTLSYDRSDPSPKYQCRPVPPFIADVTSVSITAKFTSSAPPSVITGLQTVVVLLGALGSVIVSHFPRV